MADNGSHQSTGHKPTAAELFGKPKPGTYSGYTPQPTPRQIREQGQRIEEKLDKIIRALKLG